MLRHSLIGNRQAAASPLRLPVRLHQSASNGGKYETTCSRRSAVIFRSGLGSSGRYVPKQSSRQGRKTSRRRRDEKLHDKMREGGLRAQGGRQERQTARRRRKDQLHEEM